MELNREVLDCMKNLRRRLRDELALDIRLSQPDAVNAMLSACLTSADDETRELGQRLARLSETPMVVQHGFAPLPGSVPAQSNGSVRIYRGQRVHV
ncbi:hypothetical protein [Phytopseudomonas dryadis]|uniref:Uncharacterized protein n=1 Tax=Phytopseudomonas dryadis TaxID=2487520 RepID=A0A4V2KCW3_9GAMM|nr:MULTISPECIES: hypothetical protein [Pseudomonas]TBU96457.1 hypothetical protein DNK44_04725 [Pseudomonas dryadis]TBV03486.1 hypothetical protein DNK34_16220 [Pseudomonas dryadis]TBV16538.1 hypothetical protein DNK41_14625 [Pseudomonas sp. FRB 230]